MEVVFCIPTHDGSLEYECVTSLLTTQALLIKSGIKFEVFFLTGCPYLPVARNTLVAMFMQTNATDLFFVDADIGFDATSVIKVLNRPEKIVGGIYPLKRDGVGFPVEVKTKDGIPIGRDGLIEADFIPTGFMRIKREVFEIMEKEYPELYYKTNNVNTGNAGIEEAYDFFNMGINESKKWTTEDFAFCDKWTKIGGQIWVCPDIDFTHTGRKAHKGNYHNYLIELKEIRECLKEA